MELIRNLSTKSINGHTISYVIFKCPFCLREVIKRLSDGKRAKSCGCVQYKLQAQAIKGKKHTEEHNKKISEGHKGKKRTEEAIEKTRKAHIGKKRTEEAKQKMREAQLGEKSYNWQGGKSFEIYPQEFNKKLKQSILGRDNYKCQDPNCGGNHKKLHIHHMDYDKQNNNPENLITLCISCHCRTNNKNKRVYFTEFYQNTMINKLVECLL